MRGLLGTSGTPCGQSHITGKHDYTATDRFLFQNTSNLPRLQYGFVVKLTHFLIVFTPTLRSSEKNTNF